jgi:hypothetical protein
MAEIIVRIVIAVTVITKVIVLRETVTIVTIKFGL